MLFATVRQRKIHVKKPDTVIQNGVNVDWLKLEMDDEWAEMDSIVCVFVNQYTEEVDGKLEKKEVSKQMLHTFGEQVRVPWECLEKTGMLSVSCTGYVDGEKVMTTMYPDSYWNVVQNGPVSGDETIEPTPSLYNQILAAAGEATAAAIAANQAKDQLLQDKANGVFDGADGKNAKVSVGSTKTGSEGSEAEVYATGTEQDLKLNFVIPRGAPGYTPRRGVDYWTTEDQGEIRQSAERIATAAAQTATNAAEQANTAAGNANTAAGSANAAAQSASNAETELRNAASAGEFDGKDGSDADVTAENIQAALGYKPADAEDVRSLSSEKLNIDQGVENAGKILGIGADGKVGPVDAPEGGGTEVPGENGGYYTPSVAKIDKDTIRLSFAPSKTDMPAVADVDVELPEGPAGYTPKKGVDYFDGKDGYTPVKGKDYFDGKDGVTPVKGVDYWTAEEQAEITAATEAANDAAGEARVAAAASTDAAHEANTAATAANRAADSATGAATAAGVATSSANSAASSANSAAGSAGSAASRANTAASDANDASDEARASASMANNAANFANAAAAAANTAKSKAETAATNAQNVADELTEMRNAGEFNGSDADVTAENIQAALGYKPADEEKVNQLSADIDNLKGVTIPDYWQSHIDSKITAIKALQSIGGKSCFSFVFVTDIHYPSNLGKRAPVLAKRIMDECNIKYALNAGDIQTRGCYQTKGEILAENKQVAEMFAPIKDKLLSIEGNHDGSYYWDGGSVGVGTAYTKQLTEQEMFEEYYRANGLTADVHFDKNSNAFYVDDVSNRVRYIGLNSMNVPNDADDVDADGIAKYPKFTKTQFLQAQYDFLCNEALATGLTDDWSVVVFGHSGIYNAGDYAVMVDVLSAYKDKANCVSEYAGTEAGSPAYTNLAEPLPDNTTDSSKWVNGYRISSTAITTSSGAGKTVCNPIPIKTGDVIRIKGVSFVASVDRACYMVKGGGFGHAQYVSSLPDTQIGYSMDGDVHVFTVLTDNQAYKYFRCAFSTPTNPDDVIITVNQPIVETEHGYDYVSVNHDFTNAKGKFVAYFHGHEHQDADYTRDSIKDIATRCDAREEYEEADRAERVKGTITEQSFDVFTVNTKTRTIYATKIGAGDDRVISY